MPKLSVLIPTFNRETYVKFAIESVLRQPFQDFEIICSDNSSTDGTIEVLEHYARVNSSITVIKSNKNLGPIPNWKKCLDRAKGDYIHWLWSDDWIEPNFYIDAFDILSTHKSSAVSCWSYRHDKKENGWFDKYISWQFSHPKLPGEHAAVKVLSLSKELPVSPAAYILPRSLVNKHFYTNIPAYKKLDPVKCGVGVDSLMVAGTCMDVNHLHIIQRPSVNFRKHDNISTNLSSGRQLTKMYFMTSNWFLSNHSLSLNLFNILKLIAKNFYVYRLDALEKTLNNRSIVNSILSAKHLIAKDHYKSIKANFRK